MTKPKNIHAVALGKLGGKKGGLARARNLTPERRTEIAKIAGKARGEQIKRFGVHGKKPLTA